MKVEQVAAQLFTIRDHLKTPADIAASMKKVREIGYKAVQISGMGPIEESELNKILADNGLVCCATHEGTATILDNPEKIVERLKKLNCMYTAVPSPGGIDLTTSLDDYISKMDKAGKVLADNGQVLTYHNHHMEFAKVNGKIILEEIYGRTNPKYLQGEIDTYWVQTGGSDPVMWCKKLNGRLPLLHLKDYGMQLKPDTKPVMREIGSGNLAWKEIIKASEESGCKWFIIEQDANWINNDAFESLKVSFDFVKNTLCN